MEAMTARQNWSDDRIDGLERKVDEGFRHVDQRFEQVDQRLGRVERQMDDMRVEMNAGFKHLGERLDAFQHTLVLFSGGLVVALIGLVAIQL